MDKHACPKCEAAMTGGYLLEKNMPLIEGDLTPTEWVAIEPDYFEKYGFSRQSTSRIEDAWKPIAALNAAFWNRSL